MKVLKNNLAKNDIFFRHFYWWMKPEYLEKTTHLMPVIDHFYNVKFAMGNNNQTLKF
jgi:hypothetical protein